MLSIIRKMPRQHVENNEKVIFIGVSLLTEGSLKLSKRCFFKEKAVYKEQLWLRL